MYKLIKKIMGIFMGILMVSIMLVPAYGQELASKSKISEDQAYTVAKGFIKKYAGIEINDSYKREIELEKSWSDGNKYVWRIELRKNAEDGEIQYNVEVDADNQRVLYFERYSYDSNSGLKVPVLSQEEAQNKALKYLERLQPDKVSQVKFNEKSMKHNRYDRQSYNFIYDRLVNNLEFLDNKIIIDIDNVDGSLIQYRIIWNYGQVPKKNTKVFSMKDANSLLMDKLKVDKEYIAVVDDDTRKIQEIKLIYVPAYNYYPLVDGLTGKYIKVDKDSHFYTFDISFDEKQNIYRKSLNVISDKIDKKTAEKKAIEIAKAYINEKLEIEEIRYEANSQGYRHMGKNIWEIELKKESAPKYRTYCEITLDADTGKVINFNTYSRNEQDYDKDSKIIEASSAYKKAIETIAGICPEKIREINTLQRKFKDDTDRRMFYFSFKRKVNGINYTRDGITVQIDAHTGEVLDVFIKWDENVKFPKAVGLLDEKKALDIYKETLQCKLSYMYEPNQMNKEIVLAYSLEDKNGRFGVRIDGNTGDLVNYSGKKLMENENTKIKKSEFAKELDILESESIVDLDKVDLDKKVNIIDAIRTMKRVDEFIRYVDDSKDIPVKFTNVSKLDFDYELVKYAIENNLIPNEEKNFQRKEEIDNTTLIKFLVKTLKYDKLAKSKGIFTIPDSYSNVEENEKGYVAICRGLNIIDQEKFDGKYKPNYLDMYLNIYKALINVEKEH